MKPTRSDCHGRVCRDVVGRRLYGNLVVDPAWPERPDIIQPARGGIVAHSMFELSLILSLDFIPKALAFEKAESVDQAAARSRFRLPIEILTCIFMFTALSVIWRA